MGKVMPDIVGYKLNEPSKTPIEIAVDLANQWNDLNFKPHNQMNTRIRVEICEQYHKLLRYFPEVREQMAELKIKTYKYDQYPYSFGQWTF